MMKFRHARWLPLLGAFLSGPMVDHGRALAAQDPAFAAQPPGGPEVLTRGPLHEAFATPVVFNPGPPLVVAKPPPEASVEEVPPDQKPAGADVEWIPGYWAWDDERNDYIWISGVWRDIPPGRQWVPGYWSAMPGGFGWTPGFWASTDPGAAVNYLPPPPASLEAGPNAPQPGDNYAWNPGAWIWQTDRYAWQPGYWYEAQSDWVWSPGGYHSTPSGYVYNQGYWDYPLARRGLPFAPLAFNNGPITRPVAVTPNFVLPVTGLLANLFVRPSTGRYYYGDYYTAASQPTNPGYVPWFGFRNNRVGYDPIYSAMAAQPARQPNWDQRYRDDYRNRLEHQEARPLPNFEAQRRLIDQRRGREDEIRNLGFVEPLQQWARNPNGGQPIVPVGQDHRQELIKRQAAMAEFQRLRVRQEAQERRIEANDDKAEELRRASIRHELPRSPIAAAPNPRFASRGLVAPPVQPPGQNQFRPRFGPRGPDGPRVNPPAAEPTKAARPPDARPRPDPTPNRRPEAKKQERPPEAKKPDRQPEAKKQERGPEAKKKEDRQKP